MSRRTPRKYRHREPRSIVPAMIVLVGAVLTAIITSLVSLTVVGFIPGALL
jgi:hypothetical protein